MAKLVFPSIYLLTLLSVKLQGCCANVEANVEADLIHSLLKNYNVNARPIVNKSNPIDVKVELVLFQIITLDERQQKLQMKVWQRVYWQDDFLTWNTSKHGGINRVTLNPALIWRPHITLYDDMSPWSNDASLYECIVTNEGQVMWYAPRVITSGCKVDVSFYPWDEQKCTLKLGSWTYDGASLDVFNVSAVGDLTYYTTSIEWSILAFNVKKNVVRYNCCPNPYPDVTYTLHIRRKVLYYVNNLIMPSIFITSIALMVFYLPPESGEKISLSVTVLLTLFVFMLFISESVPKSDSPPLIGSYIKVLIGILSCSTASTVITLRVHHRGVFGNKVPDWVRKVILNWLARALCMRMKIEGEFPSPKATQEAFVMPAPIGHTTKSVELTGVNVILPQNVLTANSKPVNIHEEQDTVSMGTEDQKQKGEHQEACNRDWMLVAAVIDRLLLIIFAATTLICSLVIFFYHPFYSDLEPIA